MAHTVAAGSPVVASADPSGPAHMWTAFHPDPVGIALVVAGAAGYAYGVTALRRRGADWPVRRTVMFLGPGLLSLLVFTMCWPGAYAHTLFSAYLVEMVGLFMVTPVLIACGRPGTLARMVAPARWGAATDRVTGSRPAQVLTSPVLGALLVPVVTSAVVFSGILGESLRHDPLYHLVQVLLVALGLFIAAPLVADPGRMTGLAAATALFLGFLELLLDSIPGALLTFRTHLLAAGYYLAEHRAWGPTPLHDQHTGGAILWGVGEIVDLPFIAILLVRWKQADEREAKEVDRLLDEAQAASGSPMMRPWWETDPPR
ncbi:cytochrome c oxidase assembly protein [Frankia sp. AgB32]|uniref:cytochrome c oxidase assembly protein n=1 Tax=Frankia sp. AgB32 TaxID=631119 RepID=UPI00200FA825|nr:cytochrome c oxidase assembly protein [Frankia sp. AgB32]MCK9896191.1 cytochrome c oxidase assembly protein [Frankia sp. AgB32]